MNAAVLALQGASLVLLILIAVGLIVGLGAVALNRRARGELAPRPGAQAQQIPPAPAPTAIEPPAAEAPPAADAPAADAPAAGVPVEEPVESAEPAGAVEPIERPRFRDRLGKARAALAGAITGVRGRAGITDDTWDDLEEALLRADVGVRVTDQLLTGLRARVKSKEISTPDELLAALQAEMKAALAGSDRSLRFEDRAGAGPNVWLFVGVNGVGKTTTIGKVGAQQAAEGRKVLMAAGDTFRAAAAEQLQTWAERSGAEFVRGNEGGDPSAVIFDGVQAAAARRCDLVLGDTAGRLQNKTNLMEELRKVRRVAEREPGKVTEVLLVLDATTGQNGLSQAREFAAATEVTGVVLTKLDGSAKGGIVFAIETEFGIPVKLVGLGETIGDLVHFEPEEFVDALFAE